jgi:cytochrome c
VTEEKYMRALIVSTVLLALPVPAVAAGDVAKGTALFKSRCAVCHSADAASPKVTAPTLAGVVGRKAGSLAGARYSAALKNSKVVWTAAMLDKFLLAPRDVVPGTNMIIKLAKPEDRTDVIAYLATLKGTPVK